MAVNSYNLRGKRVEGIAVEEMHIKMTPELRRLIVDAAENENLPMNETIVKILADHFGRPELGRVPRRPMGRPRKEMANAAK